MGVSAKALAAVVSGSLIVGAGLAAVSSASLWAVSQGTVERVVDGDTLIARVGGTSTTIRLLNVDTPETKHPGLPVQCLAVEASEWLSERLPTGTKIDIQYDEERTDRYGRTLAGVFEDGSLVNAEIVRLGLGVPVYYAPNDRFLGDVEAAHELAKQWAVGLFDPSIGCTLPSQVSEASAVAEAVPTAYVDGVSIEDAASKVAAVAAAAALLEGGGLDRMGHAVLRADTTLIAAADRSLKAAHELAANSYASLTHSEAEHRAAVEAARRAEAERIERERIEREQREAEERAEKERAAERKRLEQVERDRAEAQRRAQSTAPKKSTTKATSTKTTTSKTTGTKSRKCVPYGPEIPYSKAGGYTGKRYGMPGGKTFRKCS